MWGWACCSPLLLVLLCLYYSHSPSLRTAFGECSPACCALRTGRKRGWFYPCISEELGARVTILRPGLVETARIKWENSYGEVSHGDRRAARFPPKCGLWNTVVLKPWGAFSFHIAGRFFTIWATRKPIYFRLIYSFKCIKYCIIKLYITHMFYMSHVWVIMHVNMNTLSPPANLRVRILPCSSSLNTTPAKPSISEVTGSLNFISLLLEHTHLTLSCSFI